MNNNLISFPTCRSMRTPKKEHRTPSVSHIICINVRTDVDVHDVTLHMLCDTHNHARACGCVSVVLEIWKVWATGTSNHSSTVAQNYFLIILISEQYYNYNLEHRSEHVVVVLVLLTENCASMMRFGFRRVGRNNWQDAGTYWHGRECNTWSYSHGHMKLFTRCRKPQRT